MTQNPAYLCAFNLLCGDKIGDGVSRTVFECTMDPSLVVKVEHDCEYRNFANVHEWEFWEAMRYAKAVSKWLAPCVRISPDGRILLQRRAEPIRKTDVLPVKLPAFLADIKRANFGWIDGHLVAVDYARTIVNASVRMVPAHFD